MTPQLPTRDPSVAGKERAKLDNFRLRESVAPPTGPILSLISTFSVEKGDDIRTTEIEPLVKMRGVGEYPARVERKKYRRPFRGQLPVHPKYFDYTQTFVRCSTTTPSKELACEYSSVNEFSVFQFSSRLYSFIAPMRLNSSVFSLKFNDTTSSSRPPVYARDAAPPRVRVVNWQKKAGY
jgi:hypothetical protein